MITITFNTSRLYTAEGQIVTASYDPETNLCKFVDHSRMCEGQFVTSLAHLPVDETTIRLFARRVMRAYDTHSGDEYDHWIKGDKPQRQDVVHEFRI